MASTPSILITGSTSGAGTAGQAKTDLVAGETITLSDSANTSGTYSWELWVVDGSAVTLTNANTATPTFVCVAEESYLAFCTVDGVKSYSVNAAGERVSSQGGCAVLKSGERNPVPGETDQFGGWDGAFVNLLNDYRDGALGGGGSITGPGSSTDNAFVRWDGAGGGTLQDGSTTEDDSGNVTVNGNIVVTGTVDGRDVATDGTKLDGIEAAADVTDATNVAAAGAIMDSDISESEGFMRKTGAAAYEAIKTNLGASTAPTATDDSASGYAVGSRWIDTTADKEYVCLDATATAAVWTETTGGGGGGDFSGPASSTDNELVVFDGTGGKTGQANSGITASDAGLLTIPDNGYLVLDDPVQAVSYRNESGTGAIYAASTRVMRWNTSIVTFSDIGTISNEAGDCGAVNNRWRRLYRTGPQYVRPEGGVNKTTSATVSATTSGFTVWNGSSLTCTLPAGSSSLDGVTFEILNVNASALTVSSSTTITGSTSVAQDVFAAYRYVHSQTAYYRII